MEEQRKTLLFQASNEKTLCYWKGESELFSNLVKPKCTSLNNQWLQSIILFPLNTQVIWAPVSQTRLITQNWHLSQMFHQLFLCSKGCCFEGTQDKAGLVCSFIWPKPPYVASIVSDPCEIDMQRCITIFLTWFCVAGVLSVPLATQSKTKTSSSSNST